MRKRHVKKMTKKSEWLKRLVDFVIGLSDDNPGDLRTFNWSEREFGIAIYEGRKRKNKIIRDSSSPHHTDTTVCYCPECCKWEIPPE